MSVNPLEAPGGYRAKLFVNEVTDCQKCAFVQCGCVSVPCTGDEREDGQSVYFVKIKENKGSVIWQW